jgi:tRNA G18 (ribose-2'-O)-methylase SpoU
VAVEIADDATPFMDFEFPQRTCLVLGNEARGVYDSVLQRCDSAVFIPMAGKGRSINVHVAAAVVAFHALFAAEP